MTRTPTVSPLRRMAFVPLLMALALSTAGLPTPCPSSNVVSPRALGVGGLLGEPEQDTSILPTSTHSHGLKTTTRAHLLPLLGETSASDSSTPSSTATSSTPTSTTTTESVSRTPVTPGTQAFAPEASTLSPTVTTVSSSPTSTPSDRHIKPLAASAEETKVWKVIGIGVLCITTVATSILLIVFFDSWWGFLRDMVVGKRAKEGQEEMFEPYDSKKGWELKLAAENGHRYPTIVSLDSSASKSRYGQVKTPKIGGAVLPPGLKTPEAVHGNHELDPHPLEPLFRRPSNGRPPLNPHFA